MQVRHLAASYTGDLIGIGAFSTTVAIWDLASGSHLCTFDTVLDFGGQRLAISPTGDWCAAAAYTRRGLFCYHARSGEVGWRRADLKRLQFVAFSSDGQHLYCASDLRPCFVLDAGTGAEIGQLRGVRAVWDSPSGSLMLLDKGRPEIVTVEGRRLASIERATFAILDAAFSPESLCISESGGPVRCFQFDGTELWTYRPQPDRHVLSLVHAATIDRYLGIEWPFEHGGPKTLIALDRATGQRATIALLGDDPEMEFVQRGGKLVTSGGRIVDTSSGATIKELAFEERLEAAGA